jgi:hypothetical protein
MGLFHFFSGSYPFKKVFPYLVDPDLAEGANRIYLPPLGLRGLLLGDELNVSSLL